MADGLEGVSYSGPSAHRLLKQLVVEFCVFVVSVCTHLMFLLVHISPLNKLSLKSNCQPVIFAHGSDALMILYIVEVLIIYCW